MNDGSDRKGGSALELRRSNTFITEGGRMETRHVDGIHQRELALNGEETRDTLNEYNDQSCQVWRKKQKESKLRSSDEENGLSDHSQCETMEARNKKSYRQKRENRTCGRRYELDEERRNPSNEMCPRIRLSELKSFTCYPSNHEKVTARDVLNRRRGRGSLKRFRRDSGGRSEQDYKKRPRWLEDDGQPDDVKRKVSVHGRASEEVLEHRDGEQSKPKGVLSY